MDDSTCTYKLLIYLPLYENDRFAKSNGLMTQVKKLRKHFVDSSHGISNELNNDQSTRTQCIFPLSVPSTVLVSKNAS